MIVISFCCFTTQVYLFPIQDLQILSKSELVILEILNSSVDSVCKLLLKVSSDLGFGRSLSLGELKYSSTSDTSELLYISAGSYCLLRLLIPSSSFDARIILTLLAYLNLQCQMHTFLMQLTRYIGLLRPVVIMAQMLALTCITFPGIARSSINKL